MGKRRLAHHSGGQEINAEEPASEGGGGAACRVTSSQLSGHPSQELEVKALVAEVEEKEERVGCE